MNKKVLFLDYDGVVNTPIWNEKGTKCSFNFPCDNKVNNFQAVQWVSEFCQKCNYSIVVTSTWRSDRNWKECLINGGLRSGIEIIDRTDVLLDRTRGVEIEQYLKKHLEINYYIIVDDDNDMLPEQQSHFVKTDTSVGFGEKEFKQCIEIYLKDKGKGGSFK